MQRFQSPYLRLKRLRIQQEAHARLILAQRMTTLREAQALLTTREQEQRAIETALANATFASGEIRLTALGALNNQMTLVQLAQRQIETVTLQVEAARNDWKAARVETELLTRLVDRDRAIYDRDNTRRDQVTADEHSQRTAAGLRAAATE